MWVFKANDKNSQRAARSFSNLAGFTVTNS